MVSEDKLHMPLKVGHCQLAHRIAMAPLTRYRCSNNFTPLPMVKEYYEQRAAVPGTLLITEATYISEKSIGGAHTPGMWTPEHVATWKEITDTVHAKGCFIYCQLWAMGRAAELPLLQQHGLDYVSSSPTPMTDSGPVPRALEEAEILEYIRDYGEAARRAVFEAGFDGVEIHGANGFLIDQFTQDTCNKRTDRWGGSIENRSRFVLEIVRSVATAVGADRTAIRLSPYSEFLGMRMQGAREQFSYIIEQLRPLGLAYLHVVQPRISGPDDVEDELPGAEDALFVPQLWRGAGPLFLAGGFTPEKARSLVQDELYSGNDVVVIFGRYFISNPDLPFRAKHNIALTEYDRSTFYTPMQAKGYTDYAYCAQFSNLTTS